MKSDNIYFLQNTTAFFENPEYENCITDYQKNQLEDIIEQGYQGLQMREKYNNNNKYPIAILYCYTGDEYCDPIIFGIIRFDNGNGIAVYSNSTSVHQWKVSLNPCPSDKVEFYGLLNEKEYNDYKEILDSITNGNRASKNTLKKQNSMLAKDNKLLKLENKELRVEIKKLKEENDRLISTLQKNDFSEMRPADELLSKLFCTPLFESDEATRLLKSIVHEKIKGEVCGRAEHNSENWTWAHVRRAMVRSGFFGTKPENKKQKSWEDEAITDTDFGKAINSCDATISPGSIKTSCVRGKNKKEICDENIVKRICEYLKPVVNIINPQ